MRIIIGLVILTSILSCNTNHSEKKTSISGDIKKNADFELKYAKGFTVKSFDGYKLLSVYNPWQKAQNIIYRYIVKENPVAAVADSLLDLPVFTAPLEKVICLSTTHIAMLDFIEEKNAIVAVSGSNFISDSLLQAKIAKNQLPDIGFDRNLNYELLIALKPDVVFAYAVTGEITTNLRRLEDLGVRVVMIGEYLESDPLGKAEWVKFMAAFFNKTNLAKQKLTEISAEYNHLTQVSSNIEDKPCVITGLPWKGSWFTAGGKSYAASLIKDAGGNYLWNADASFEAFPVAMEVMIQKANTCDFWINCGNATSLQEIKNVDERLSYLSPFKNGKVYNNNKRIQKSGGNDYWESGVMNPHLVLKDLICIFHPELLPDHQLVYYKLMQ